MNLLFKEILKKLEVVNEEFPDVELGEFLQNAVDWKKKVFNADLRVSSKFLLNSVNDFFEREKSRRRL
jgi:hypothetical protein